MARKFDVPGWLVLALGLAATGAMAGGFWLSRVATQPLDPGIPVTAPARVRTPGTGQGTVLHGIGLGLAGAAALAGLLHHRQRRARERTLAAAYGALLQRARTDLTALAQVGDGVLVADGQGHVEALNAAAETLTGWTTSEAAGRPLDEVLRLTVDGPVSAEPAGGEGSPVCELHTRGGGSRPVSRRTVPALNAAGTVVGRVVVLRDLSTERAAAARADASEQRLQTLAESEQQYRALVDNASEAIFVAQDGQFVFTNSLLEELLGYSHAELSALPLAQFVHEEDRDFVLERHSRRIDGHGEPQAYAFRIRTRRGEVRWADLKTVAVTWRGRPATLNYASDATERKRTEDALRRSAESFRELFNATEEAIFIDDAVTGEIRDANASALRMYGYESKPELVGKTLPELGANTPPYTESRARELIRQAVEEGPCTFEWLARRRDGGTFFVEVSLKRSEIGGESCLLAVARDITGRRAVEAALRESQHLLERTGAAARVGGWELDLATRVPRWTEQTRRIHEVPDDYQPTLASALSFFDPAARSRLEKAIHDAGETGKSWDLELPFTTARGTPRWVRVLGQAEFEDGRAVRLSGAFQDITDRKEAEAQLRLHSTALEVAANSIVITDPAGNIQWANRAFTNRSGYSLAEARGRNPRDLVRSGAHSRAHFKDLWTTILAGRVWRGEMINRGKDGRLYTEETTITPLVDERGRVTHFIAIKQDVTERERNEAEQNQMLHHIYEQTAQMTRIMQSAPAAVALLAPDGEVLLSNTRADEEFSREPDVLRNNHLVRLGDYPLEKLLQSPAPLLWHEVRVQSRTLEAVATPVDAESTPTGWVLVFHDVTQQREVQRQLERHERLSAIGQLAAGIAHDFNNIAQVIVLHVQLLKSSPRLNPGDQEHLAAINAKALQASAMIQQILDFSRRTSLERHVVDLAALCRDEAALLRRTLPRPITVAFEHDGTDCRADADSNRLRQVLMNLAFNARDAMPGGGELRLAVARIEVSPTQTPPAQGITPGSWVRLTVADSGIGMTPEVQQHLFEPFYTTKSPGRGTGLGLAQVHGIVGQHGGYIHLASRPKEGTTFTIFFPAVRGSEGSVAAVPPAPAAPAPPGMILVVEDDDAVRAVLVQILTVMGYQCLEATDGLQALTELQSPAGARVGLVLSDWRMPRMDGAALFRALRAQGSTLPMILLTGFADADELRPLLQEGLAGWLPKPLDLPRLAGLITRTLSRPREG